MDCVADNRCAGGVFASSCHPSGGVMSYQAKALWMSASLLLWSLTLVVVGFW